ncbi:transcriptional regulator [Listeria innocua]|nr:transcriptional regulator [Listeria innocua]EAE2437362.1 transcriptional regulator [Listeria innocua]EAG8533344.1 transcriptional regulator [Listeria innocua]ECC1773129.1 helix-turn-helix domain-containing protein [Listeria innocua]EDO1139706.1 helix-turn-helix domain-containing protein [Listeria innocua]
MEVLNLSIIGDRLKETRISRNLTQKEVADKLNITIGAVSGYERGYREPNLTTLHKLADLYNVFVDYLLGRTKSKIDWIEIDKKYDQSILKAELKAFESEEIDLDDSKYKFTKELSDLTAYYEGKLLQERLQINLNIIQNKDVTTKLAGKKLSPKEQEALKLFLAGLEKLRNI